MIDENERSLEECETLHSHGGGVCFKVLRLLFRLSCLLSPCCQAEMEQ